MLERYSLNRLILRTSYIQYTGPTDFNVNASSITLQATTNRTATVVLMITILDQDILQGSKDFTIALIATQNRVTVSNSTSVVILNDDGEA